MKAKIFGPLIVIGFILFLQSCAPTQLTKMTAVVSSDQKIGYEESIISQKKHFVSLAPYSELNIAKEKTMFLLWIQSGGDTSFDIGYDNISVFFQDSGMTLPVGRITVQPYEDFMDDVRVEQSEKEKIYIRDALEDVILKIELSASSFSSSSSFSNGDSSFSGGGGSGGSGGGGASSSGGSSSNSTDSTGDSVEIMLEDLEMDIESMRANNQLLREALPEIILKPQTVVPGGAFSGVVVCDTRDLGEEIEGRFQVAVLVDSEKHTFTFNRLLNK